MDRPPFYPDLRDPRASASRPASGRFDEGARRAIDRLPPVLPSSHSLPKLPVGRSDGLAPLGHGRLPPMKDSSVSSYTAQRPYPPMADRHAFESARRTSPPSSLPAGMVSADYLYSARSPGESAPVPYLPTHSRHPDPYRQDMPPAHPSSRMPHAVHYDMPPAHMRNVTEIEPVATSTPVKRPRVSLACLACRNRKSRCDGVRPACKTCANMKIECKWPEVDFRRAKSGDAARARKRSPGGPSTRTSPELTDQKPRGMAEPTQDLYGRPSSGLPPSQSMPVMRGGGQHPQSASLTLSPDANRINRYRTLSDGDRDGSLEQPSLQAHRSPSERHVLPRSVHERQSPLFGRSTEYERPYSSSGLSASRYEARPALSTDERVESFAQDRYAEHDGQASRPIRALPEPRTYKTNATATRCLRRAATIAILARPATDSQRAFVESQMKLESSLEDLADGSTAGERLGRAFAADWDAIGGLSRQARRPFMDVAAGIIGILEFFGGDAQCGAASHPADPSARLHMFRLRHGQAGQPELRHISIAVDLSPREKRNLMETTSTAVEALSYPIPVDRLSQPLVDCMQRALAAQEAKNDSDDRIAQPAQSVRSPVHASPMPPADTIPFAQQRDVKPPQHVVEVFFEVFVETIGDQVPGLDTRVVGARIKDDSISALMANALCGIGASLYERAGRRMPTAEANSSNVYVDRARALIGAALHTPDVEAIVALGVIAIRDMLMGQMVSAAAIVSSAVSLCKQLDLHRGHHEPSLQASSVSHLAAGEGERAKKLDAGDVFWMIYCLDRITSIVTARSMAIKDRDIDAAFPSTIRHGEPCIFAALVRQLHYLGRLSELDPSGGQEPDRARQMDIAAIGADLVGHYNSLASVLRLGPANLRRAHERKESLSFLQLHLAHNMAMIHLSFVSQAPTSEAGFDKVRMAAREVVEICMLGEALDSKLLADTPLSSIACFLAACVTLSEIEVLEESMQSGSIPESSIRTMAAQLDLVQADLAKLMKAMSEHAKFWPVARRLADILEAQKNKPSVAEVSSRTITELASQIEAIHVLVRPPRQESARAPVAATTMPVEVKKVADLESLRACFPHLC